MLTWGLTMVYGPYPSVDDMTAAAGGHQQSSRKSQCVFVVYGRNDHARSSIFAFLRAIGLQPIEWSQARALTNSASPYVEEILDAALESAQAVVVLMTPDEIVSLRPDYANGDDDPDIRPSVQARPNVLFEAGLALGRAPKRTVLVELGKVRPFSDISGRHILRMDDSIAKRQELAQRLKSAGCIIDLTGTDWHTMGSFASPPLPKGDAGVRSADIRQKPVVTVSARGNPSPTEKKIIFSGLTMKPVTGRYKTFVGEVANVNDIGHAVGILATFYDSHGAILGTAGGYVRNLASGETKTFEIRTTDNIQGYADMKLQVNSLYNKA